jgi:hypothetical protein
LGADRLSLHTEQLILDILPQPDDLTCGPTCLHAVYRYYGDRLSLEQVVREVTPLVTGGTLAVFMGCHALARGFDATLYTYNLDIFDPTWFADRGARLAERLRQQAEIKSGAKLQVATQAYLDFLELGGEIRFEELRPELIRGHLMEGRPILTGLLATYLYGCAREVDRGGQLVYDSVAGEPTGHFVIVHGYDVATDSVLVADPLHENPRFSSHNYRVGVLRLMGSVLLGVLTYDANLLVIIPREDAP